MSVDHAELFKTARGRVLHLLWDQEWHPHHDLARVGGVRYSARLLELKRQGYRIEDRPYRGQEVGKEYRLMSQAREREAAKEKRVKVFLEEADAAKVASGILTAGARQAVQTALESFDHNRGKL